MGNKKEEAVAPTTTPKKLANLSYHSPTKWSTSMSCLLASLLLACQSQALTSSERKTALEHATELILLRADLWSIGKEGCHA